MNAFNMLKPVAKYLTAGMVLVSLSIGVMAKPDMYKQLDLSDEQKQQIKETRTDKKQQHKAFKSSMKLVKQKSLALLDNYSESEAEEVAQEMADIIKQKTLSRLAHHQAVYAILTSEQKQKYKTLLSERKMFHGFKHKHGSNRHSD